MRPSRDRLFGMRQRPGHRGLSARLGCRQNERVARGQLELVVAGAVVAMLRAGAASVAVGEGPGHRRDVETFSRSNSL